MAIDSSEGGSTAASETHTGVGRLVFVDVMKVIAIAVVIAHHAGQAYGPGAADWAVDDAAMSVWLDAFFRVNAAFGMGLMFLLAGYFVPRSYDRKGARLFLSERWKRIGIPMALLILIIHLPAAYFTEEANLSLSGFIRSLYDTGLKTPYFHLWFLGHLLLYSAGYVLLRRYTEHRRGNGAPFWPAPTHSGIVGFVVALTLITWLVRIVFPIDHWWPIFFVVAAEPAHLPQYVSLFAIGAMAYRGDWLRHMSTRMGVIWLGVGITASAGVYYMTLFAPERAGQILDDGGSTAASLLYGAWEAVISAGLCVGLMVVGRTLFQRTNRFLRATSEAAYVAYMLHFGLVIVIQAAIVDVDASANTKFLFVAGLGIPLSFGLAHLTRRVPGLPNVLGTSPAQATASTTAADDPA
jgi:surface polysaccharide O-acyltransferase-like enzyme